MTARDEGRALLAAEAEPRVLAALDAAEAAGEATWQHDPFIPGVVGLVRPDNSALAVVYVAEADFELDGDVEAAL